MTELELRNHVTKGLSDFLSVPVILHSPDAPEPSGLYLYYMDVYADNVSVEGSHIYTAIPSQNPQFDHDLRHNMVGNSDAQYRFVVVAPAGAGAADAAQAMAEKAKSYFRYVGELPLRDIGIAVIDVSNPQDVTVYEIDGMSRRWSFDVTFRHLRVDTRIDANIEAISVEHIKE